MSIDDIRHLEKEQSQLKQLQICASAHWETTEQTIRAVRQQQNCDAEKIKDVERQVPLSCRTIPPPPAALTPGHCLVAKTPQTPAFALQSGPRFCQTPLMIFIVFLRTVF